MDQITKNMVAILETLKPVAEENRMSLHYSVDDSEEGYISIIILIMRNGLTDVSYKIDPHSSRFGRYMVGGLSGVAFIDFSGYHSETSSYANVSHYATVAQVIGKNSNIMPHISPFDSYFVRCGRKESLIRSLANHIKPFDSSTGFAYSISTGCIDSSTRVWMSSFVARLIESARRLEPGLRLDPIHNLFPSIEASIAGIVHGIHGYEFEFPTCGWCGVLLSRSSVVSRFENFRVQGVCPFCAVEHLDYCPSALVADMSTGSYSSNKGIIVKREMSDIQRSPCACGGSSCIAADGVTEGAAVGASLDTALFASAVNKYPDWAMMLSPESGVVTAQQIMSMAISMAVDRASNSETENSFSISGETIRVPSMRVIRQLRKGKGRALLVPILKQGGWL